MGLSAPSPAQACACCGWFRFYPSRYAGFARGGVPPLKLMGSNLYYILLYFMLSFFYRFCRQKLDFIVETGHALSLLLFSLVFVCCQNQSIAPAAAPAQISADTTIAPQIRPTAKSIHILVALCDNVYQRIPPVPARIGNGQDTENNLYWGWGYGLRTYFGKSADWQLISQERVDSLILERLVFRHRQQKDYYLVADAYNGKYIATCISQFISACLGRADEQIKIDNQVLGLLASADLRGYVGHNGLMDTVLQGDFSAKDSLKRPFMVVACFSQQYFAQYLQDKAQPLLLQTHLLGAEAYSIHAAIAAYLADQNPPNVAKSAAVAYAKYQKCSYKAVSELFTNDW
jgi:hypothetical protein